LATKRTAGVCDSTSRIRDRAKHLGCSAWRCRSSQLHESSGLVGHADRSVTLRHPGTAGCFALSGFNHTVPARDQLRAAGKHPRTSTLGKFSDPTLLAPVALATEQQGISPKHFWTRRPTVRCAARSGDVRAGASPSVRIVVAASTMVSMRRRAMPIMRFCRRLDSSCRKSGARMTRRSLGFQCNKFILTAHGPHSVQS